MSVELAIYLYNSDLYAVNPEYEIKTHPSGFNAYFNKKDGPFKGRIDLLDLKKEFRTVIYNNDYKDNFLENWTPHLIKLFDFFNKLSPDKVKEIWEKFNSFNFDFGIFEETAEDPSKKDFINKHQNYFYIQISESNNHAFSIREFHEKLNEKDITRNFNYCDTPETVFLFKDLEIETLNRVFDNILELREINNEIMLEEIIASENYYEKNSPWLRIK
jgi:hypothetical protein